VRPQEVSENARPHIHSVLIFWSTVKYFWLYKAIINPLLKVMEEIDRLAGKYEKLKQPWIFVPR